MLRIERPRDSPYISRYSDLTVPDYQRVKTAVR